MSDLSFIKTPAGLVPATEHDKEAFDKWKQGSVIAGKFKQVRNAKFHRKLFALLNLTFDYYEPSSGVLTTDEKRIAKKIFMRLDSLHTGDGFMIDFGREFLREESQERKSKIANIEKAFEPFRKDIIIESGFYYEVKCPSGIRKEAKSISFANMDEIEFNQLYKAVFNTCWNFVLSRYFEDENQAQDAAEKMLSFT